MKSLITWQVIEAEIPGRNSIDNIYHFLFLFTVLSFSLFSLCNGNNLGAPTDEGSEPCHIKPKADPRTIRIWFSTSTNHMQKEIHQIEYCKLQLFSSISSSWTYLFRRCVSILCVSIFLMRARLHLNLSFVLQYDSINPKRKFHSSDCR